MCKYKQELHSKLWEIAGILWGKIPASDNMNYTLGFIFFKYLSENIETKTNERLNKIKITDHVKEWLIDKDVDIVEYNNIDSNTEMGKKQLNSISSTNIKDEGYSLAPHQLFSEILKKGNRDTGKEGEDNNILESLNNVLKEIEKTAYGTDSQEDFEGIFSDVNLTGDKLGRDVNIRNETVIKILNVLSQIDFKLKDSNIDLLGDAYEYLLGKFASDSNNGGEYYTPKQMSTVLARIVTTGKKELKNVYDPTCGSGSLLLQVKNEIGKIEGGRVGTFYGQELNRTTYNLARMNMVLHKIDFKAFNIKWNNTLSKPQHKEIKMDAIVANPPFSVKNWYFPLVENDTRFTELGGLAPKGKADFAFLQHGISQLDENGTMAAINSLGVLFTDSNKKIRQHLIEEKNYLDAVIVLPSSLFFNTGIPSCILVFKKCRKKDEDILFIDSSLYFEKGKQNVLRDSDVEKLVSTYRERKEEDKYSRLVPLDEVKENEYNLNMPRYVDITEEEEEIDLEETSREILELREERKIIDKEIEKDCKELGIPMPF